LPYCKHRKKKLPVRGNELAHTEKVCQKNESRTAAIVLAVAAFLKPLTVASHANFGNVLAVCCC
jgi:hypothetical protein